jgi:hypothetical protein
MLLPMSKEQLARWRAQNLPKIGVGTVVRFNGRCCGFETLNAMGIVVSRHDTQGMFLVLPFTGDNCTALAKDEPLGEWGRRAEVYFKDVIDIIAHTS